MKARNLTKADLIKEVSRTMKVTRKESEVIVESIVKAVVKALRSGDRIEIPGLGTFQTPQRPPRAGRKREARVPVDPSPQQVARVKPSAGSNSAVSNSGAPCGPASTSHSDLTNQTGLVPRADRVPFRYAVQLILEDGRRRSVKTLNISQSGMLVESLLPIKTGSRVRIRTTALPFLCIGASIRRCARQWLVYRISLEFDSLLSKLF